MTLLSSIRTEKRYRLSVCGTRIENEVRIFSFNSFSWSYVNHLGLFSQCKQRCKFFWL